MQWGWKLEQGHNLRNACSCQPLTPSNLRPVDSLSIDDPLPLHGRMKGLCRRAWPFHDLSLPLRTSLEPLLSSRDRFGPIGNREPIEHKPGSFQPGYDEPFRRSAGLFRGPFLFSDGSGLLQSSKQHVCAASYLRLAQARPDVQLHLARDRSRRRHFCEERTTRITSPHVRSTGCRRAGSCLLGYIPLFLEHTPSVHLKLPFLGQSAVVVQGRAHTSPCVF